VYNHFDGDSRKQRIRYDTPNFYGLQLRVGHSSAGTTRANTNTHDAGLFYGAAFKGYTVRAALAAVKDDGDYYRQYNGNVSVLAPFGTNLTLASGTRDYKNRPNGSNSENYFVKLGQHVDIVD
jgi:hypothetical protein